MTHIQVHIPSEPTVLAYIAGILDGEAYIGIVRCKKINSAYNRFYALAIQVKATDVRMIDYLYNHIGGYRRIELRKTSNNKTVYVWSIDGNNAMLLLEALYGYLVCKQEQARICIEFRKSFSLPRLEYKNALNPLTVAYRENCYQKIKQLHRIVSKKGDWAKDKK